MEHEIVETELAKYNSPNYHNEVSRPKYIYSPVYLQILLLAVNFYKCAIDQMNINIVVERVIAMEECFKCDAEISRIIVGFTHILNNQLIGDEATVRMMLESLPEFVRRLCNIRQEGDLPENDYDMDD